MKVRGGVSFLSRRASAILLAVLMVMSTLIIVVAPEGVEAARVSPVRTTAGWALEVVDGRNDTGLSTSMAIDQFGHSHIAYAQYDDYFLYYATNSGGSWKIEKLGGPVDPEQEVSLAVDAEGKAHVLYMKYDSDFENLTYATNAGGSWVSTVIGPKVSGAYNDLFIDPSGVMHMAYTVSDDSWSNTVLMYANNSGGAWNAPTQIDSSGDDTGMYCSLAVSDHGTIYIAYQEVTGSDRILKLAQKPSAGSWSTAPLDFTAGLDKMGYHVSIAVFDDEVHISYCDQSAYDLRYKHFDGVAWLDTVTVDGDGEVGVYSSIGLDSKGVPHIAYYDISNGMLKMAEKTGTEWNVMVVDGASTTGYYCSLAITPDDRVRISYKDETNDDLCLASEDIWTTDTVQSGLGLGRPSSMALDDDGNAYIAYGDLGNKDLRFATNAGGSWVTELVDSEGDVGSRLSLDIDDDRNAHISYLERTDSSIGYIKYATNAGGSWNIVRIAQVGDDAPQANSLKVDSAGNIHIFFYNMTDGAMDLWYATNAGGSWDVSLFEACDLGIYYGVGGDNSLFIDSSDNLHVAYKRSLKSGSDYRVDVVYANNTGGTWSYEIAASGSRFGQDSSLAVGLDGKAHISFREGTRFGLVYATNAGGSWTNTTIASGAGSSSSLAVDSKGKVHIGFLNSTEKTIRYMTNADGNWARTTVANISDSSSDIRCSLVLDSGDKAHIAYYDGTGGTRGLKYSTNSAWKMTVLYDGPFKYAPGYSSMKIDKNGWVHVSYYVTKNTSLMYATNFGGVWKHTLIDGAGAVQAGNYNSLALDPNGKVHISYVDSLNHHLKYANNTGRGWTNITLDDRVNVSSVTSIAVDGDGKAYISYYATATGNLKCATNRGGAWVVCTVDDSANDVGSFSSIAIQSLSRTYRPHISYYDATSGDPYYAEFTGTLWATASWTLQSIYPGPSDAGMYNSLALDSAGNAYVSFYDETYDDLMVATNIEGYWDYKTVDSGGGIYSSMVRSSSGTLYIAYYDEVNQDLKLAVNINGKYPTDGGWGITTVDCAGDVGERPSICLGTQNTVHISYTDDTRDDLKHAQMLAETSPPFGLMAAASGADAVLSWSAPRINNGCVITGYVLERTAVSGVGVTQLNIGNVLSYVDAGLSDGNYTYKVAAVNAIGTSAYSNQAAVTIDATVISVPSAPTNVLTYSHNERVELVWQAPLSDGGSPITNYKVYRGNASGTLVLWSTLGNVLTYQDFEVENGNTYYYAISAVNGIGEGAQSSEVFETPQGLPSAPMNLTATMDGDDVTLTWERPIDDGGSSALSYTVYRGEVSGSLTQLIALGDVLTYIDLDIGLGQDYFYQVSAVNDAGEGPLSNTVSVLLGYVPSAPIHLGATAEGAGIVLTWDEPEDNGGWNFTGYKVYRGTSATGLVLKATLGLVLNYTDYDLVAGTEYYYAVSAVSSMGEGDRSAAIMMAANSVPSAPRNLDLDAGNATITLSWDAPTSAGGSPITGYSIYRGTSADNLTLLDTVGLVTTYTDDTVVNNQTYYYKVTAVNVIGEGAASDVEQATPSVEGGADDDESGDNTMLYIIIAIVAVAAIAGVAVLFLRKK